MARTSGEAGVDRRRERSRSRENKRRSDSYDERPQKSARRSDEDVQRRDSHRQHSRSPSERDQKRRRLDSSPGRERVSLSPQRRSSRGEHNDTHHSNRCNRFSRSPTGFRLSRHSPGPSSRRSGQHAGRDHERRTHHRSRRSPSRVRSSRRIAPTRQSPSPRPSPRRARKSLPSQEEAYTGQGQDEAGTIVEAPPKQKPNYKSTGLLAAEANKVVVGHGQGSQSIVLKYHEPPEARKPPAHEAWLVYIFKGASPDPLHTIQLHSRSCWLLGREIVVADIPIEHPSCSKQHAVLQFKYVVKKDEWGEKKGKVGLYILDLESANGTKLNGEKIEAARYVELLSGDVVKFGESEREYVVLLPPKP